MSTTADAPSDSDLEIFLVADCEMIVKLRMPTNLHQKTMQLPNGNVFQETILSKEAAVRVYTDLHRALFGGTIPMIPPKCHHCGESLT